LIFFTFLENLSFQTHFFMLIEQKSFDEKHIH
jgi:hypothetical protein